MSKKPKVLVIGWDSADWKIINPLMDAGEMPALQSLVENGVCGNIATIDPPLSPMLWTSIATGMRPHKHGILGFLEPDQSGKNLRQTHITSRKVKAIWNILNQNDKKCNVISWWPSHPAEPVNGTIISNFYQTANFAEDAEHWELKKGCVYPENMHDFYASLRVHPTELTPNHLLPFVPKINEINQEKDASLLKLAKNIAETASIHNAFTYLLENDKEWDFFGVYYEAPDLIAHGFMKFHPPKMDHIPQHFFDIYKDVVNGIYRFMDMCLDRTLQLIDEDTTVILLSDHGFHSDHLRPKSLPKEPAAIALEHSPYGIFVAKGPGIKKDERVYGASVLDITPTILQIFNLPVGADMDGKPLNTIFDHAVKSKVIPSWEFVEGNTGQHPKDLNENSYEVKDDKALKQLADLGYIEAPGESSNDDVNFNNNLLENKFYLARSYNNAFQYSQAIDILEEIYIQKPVKLRFAKYLLECLLNINHTERAWEIYHDLKTLKESNEAEQKADENNKTKKTSDIISENTLLQIEAALLMQEKKYSKALSILERIYKHAKMTDSKLPLADAYFKTKNYDKAISVYENEIVLNAQNSHAYYQIGLCYYFKEDYSIAIDKFLDSIGLLYFNPIAHYYLGEAFYKEKYIEEAAQAFEVAIRMSPRMYKARKRLKEIYRDDLKNEARLNEIFKDDIYENSPVIYIVSGLPRSGTSLMMQMLEAGGLSIYTDENRKADENNPKGYYEHDAVKSIQKNNKWLGEAVGKTVKIVSHLLPFIPMQYKYKIIYMERELDEVLNSQTKMLQHLGKLPENTIHISLEQNFKRNELKTKEWLEDKLNVDVLYINYNELIEDSIEITAAISDFLAIPLDLEKMILKIDKSLYRNKKNV